MKRCMIGFIFCSLLLLLHIQSRADTIYLKNGNKIDGIITRETGEFVYIEMPLGTISLSKTAIESIQRSSVEDAERAKQKWERERKKKEREEAAKARFEDRQRAKGLLQYKGTWITPDKLAEIEQQKGARATEAIEGELAELKKEIETLKSENDNLKAELTRLRGQFDQQSQEQLRLTREMLEKQKESLEFQKEAEKREIGQRPPHIWVAPRIDQFSPYPTPSR